MAGGGNSTDVGGCWSRVLQHAECHHRQLKEVKGFGGREEGKRDRAGCTNTTHVRRGVGEHMAAVAAQQTIYIYLYIVLVARRSA